MNELNRQPTDNLAVPNERRARSDLLTAQFVEVGIVLQFFRGTYEAAEYLRSRKIDMNVASRALTQPLNRRTWRDWNYPSPLKDALR